MYTTKLPACVIPAILATGHVYDISIPDSFMYIPGIGYVPNVSRFVDSN